MKFRFFLLLAHLFVIFECQHSLNCATHVCQNKYEIVLKMSVVCENPSKTLLVQGETVPLEALNDLTCIYA